MASSEHTQGKPDRAMLQSGFPFPETFIVALITEKNRSRSNPKKKPYTTIVDDTGRLGCDCRGWTVHKPGKGMLHEFGRRCVHTDDLCKKHNLTTIQQGDFRHVTNLNLKVSADAADDVVAVTSPKSKAPKAARKEPEMAYGVMIVTADDAPTLDPYVEPMLASPMPDLPDQKVATVLKALSRYPVENWMMEEKFDGHRVIVAVMPNGVIKAWSRPKEGNESIVRQVGSAGWPPHIVEEFKKLRVGTYDGELYVPGGVSTDVTDLERQNELVFVVFDVLRLHGQNTTGCPYDERRSYLETMFERVESDVIHLANAVAPSAAFVQSIFDRQGEGCILKRRMARYQPGVRSKDFIKVKGLESCVMTITRFEKKKSGPYSVVWLKNPLDDSITHVKTQNLVELAKFNEAGKNGTIDSFIGRELRIEYQFRTRDGGYRHPRWDRWENE
jgi:ATP-dependent DNA ligase